VFTYIHKIPRLHAGSLRMVCTAVRSACLSNVPSPTMRDKSLPSCAVCLHLISGCDCTLLPVLMSDVNSCMQVIISVVTRCVALNVQRVRCKSRYVCRCKVCIMQTLLFSIIYAYNVKREIITLVLFVVSAHTEIMQFFRTTSAGRLIRRVNRYVRSISARCRAVGSTYDVCPTVTDRSLVISSVFLFADSATVDLSETDET
jgi:hypothetical protein